MVFSKVTLCLNYYFSPYLSLKIGLEVMRNKTNHTAIFLKQMTAKLIRKVDYCQGLILKRQVHNVGVGLYYRKVSTSYQRRNLSNFNMIDDLFW